MLQSIIWNETKVIWFESMDTILTVMPHRKQSPYIDIDSRKVQGLALLIDPKTLLSTYYKGEAGGSTAETRDLGSL